MNKFEQIKVGDVVTRSLCGIKMRLRVTKVDNLIHCGDWTFSLVNGMEIDEELGWNKDYSGSYLIIEGEPNG